MATTESKPPVTVVGAGLVGSLAALFLARRGHPVDVFEKRMDIRTQNLYEGRSINLALSQRGIASLRAVGLAEKVIENGMPMRARMIHSRDGSLHSLNYGLHGECIYSVDRRKLNEALLSAAETMPNVRIHFDHQLMNLDFSKKEAIFQSGDREAFRHESALFIGTDGAFSNVRKQLMKNVRMNYEQFYIDHGYKELTMPAAADGGFLMDHTHLHIWPRQTFMLIALPNKDGTFTCTLFMPYANFDSIKTEDDVLHMFEREFPDALNLIGRDRVLHDYFANPTGALVTVKIRDRSSSEVQANALEKLGQQCWPYHYEDSVLIMGDAAHAMVPFYGQGMNAGFQDVLVFDRILDEVAGDFGRALPIYTERRHPDAVAICDLAMYNYIEMRSKVTSSWFLLQRKAEAMLHYLAPRRIIPLYSMVSFTEIPYSQAMRRWKSQMRLVNASLGVAGLGLVAAAGVSAAFLFARFSRRT